MSSSAADPPGHVAPGSERAWAVRGYTEVRTLGGGGFGEPGGRDPEQVRADLRDRRLSPGAAASAYGVEA